MIISLRGTHGSGKSTVVKSLIDRYHADSLIDDTPRRKILGYTITIPWLRQPVYVVGPYDRTCGGCDAIQPYSLIWPRVVEYATTGHVLFEGAMVTSSYGSIGRASEVYGSDFVFAFMNTPLEVCLERIAARRKARGDERPVNPKITSDKWRTSQRLVDKIAKEFCRRVVVLDYKKAVAQVLGLFLSSERTVLSTTRG